MGLRQKRNEVVSGPTLAGHAGVLWSGVGNDYNKGHLQNLKLRPLADALRFKAYNGCS